MAVTVPVVGGTNQLIDESTGFAVIPSTSMESGGFFNQKRSESIISGGRAGSIFYTGRTDSINPLGGLGVKNSFVGERPAIQEEVNDGDDDDFDDLEQTVFDARTMIRSRSLTYESLYAEPTD